LEGVGRHLNLKIDYQIQNQIYISEKNENSTSHQLNASGNVELLQDFLFFDTKASIYEQNISSFAPSPTNNTTISDNSTNVRIMSFSPYLVNHFGSIASSVLRYTHETVDTSKRNLLAGDTNKLTLDINSGSSFRLLSWGLQFSDQKIAHRDANSVGMTMSTASLRYLLREQFNLTASGGFEKNDYISIKAKPEGTFWSTGFSWKPTDRSSLSATAGKRFFGSTYSLAANHRARNTVWNIRYGEDITTTQSQFTVPVAMDTLSMLDGLYKSIIPEATQRQVFIDGFMRVNNLGPSISQNINLFTNSVFLQKNLQASVGLNGAKNTVLLTMFNISREAQSDQIINSSSSFFQEDKSKQVGASVLWNHRMSPIMTANMGANFSKISSFPTGKKSIVKSATTSLSRQMNQKTRASLEWRRQQQSINQIDGNFNENAISASLAIGF